jgi:hypothetical protein
VKTLLSEHDARKSLPLVVGRRINFGLVHFPEDHLQGNCAHLPTNVVAAPSGSER